MLKTYMDTSVAREQFDDFLKLNNCIRGEFTARIVDPVVTFVTM